MTFLNPLLLLGALGIGLPILAHLLNKHQFKQTDWAAMQFLNRAVNVRSRQIKLRDFLLLLLRCLAILLLVLAIAKPILEEIGLNVKSVWTGDGEVEKIGATHSVKLNLIHCYR